MWSTIRGADRGRLVSRAAGISLVGVISLAFVPTASAHSGTMHAGTPHWILLGIFMTGVAVLVGSVLLSRAAWMNRPRHLMGSVLIGMGLVTLGAIGLTEIQIEPLSTNATPIPRDWYPVITLIAGATLLLGSLLLGIWRWEDRPAYAALGSLLGLWVLYPVLIPGSNNYFHPLGYGLVLSVPVVVGYIGWRYVVPAIADADRLARRMGAMVAIVFTTFLLFSTGQFTLNPETGTNVPDEAFVVFTEFAEPLVLWPAVEFYYPSVPLFGALSVGTVITFGLLAGMVGVNGVLGTMVWQRDISIDGSRGVLGGLATTGATACCCCAPAFYGVTSAVLGVSASPMYWVFLDPRSPLGALFFVGAIALMTGSAVQLAKGLDDAGVCDIA